MKGYRRLYITAVAAFLYCALPTPAAAETPINAHHMYAAVGTTSVLVRARLTFRTYLGLINASSVVLSCTVDGEDAVANEGIRLAAAGTTGDRHFFDRNVPLGAVKCIAASGAGNRLLVIEGR